MQIEADIVVVGAGCGGSLTAAILRKAGFDVVLTERGRHPRFAIGESSTPAANLVLKQLAETHDLDFLRPLCKYGTWRKQLPQIRRGLKRGFSYFAHEPGTEFRAAADHSNELLVAASSEDEVGDTQWYRSDVDAYLCEQACALGVRVFEQTLVTRFESHSEFATLDLLVDGQPAQLQARMLVDATAGNLVEIREPRIPLASSTLLTNTRAIYGHFDGLPKWSDICGSSNDHPFTCDDSAMHHLLDVGWMWWIRFDDGTTSVGLVIDNSKSASLAGLRFASAQAEWEATLARYPSLKRAFRNATCVAGLFSTGRLQRGSREFQLSNASETCGQRCVRLPNALGFVDPLHSTGLAHTFSGVARVTDLLIEQRLDEARQSQLIREYTTAAMSELRWIDDLVSGCYAQLHDFGKFTAASMCYFAAATTFERRFLAGDKSVRFLCADDDILRGNVQAVFSRDTSEPADTFENACRDALAPFNHVGLFSPTIRNMYAYTALPE